MGYDIFDIYYRFAQQHINTFCERINSQTIVGSTTRIRLQAAQNQLWIQKSILESELYKEQIIPHQNLTLDIIFLAKQYDIQWSTSKATSRITTISAKGTIHVSHLWNNDWKAYRTPSKQLQQYKISFLEQILDFKYNLMEWKYLRTKIKGGKGIIPKWYEHIKTQISVNTSHLQEFQNKRKHAYNLTQLEDQPDRLKSKGWTATLTNTNDIIYGKIARTKGKNKNATTNQNARQSRYIIHYTENKQENERTQTLKPKQNNTYHDINNRNTNTRENNRRDTNSQSQSLIDHILLTTDSNKNQLTHIRSTLATQKELTFYTDGSLNNKYVMGQMRMGWLLTKPPIFPAPYFVADTDQYPSSTKAELMAILTALIVAHTKTWHKTDYSPILQTIKQIIAQLQLNLNLIKVKAHTTDVNNNIVDNLVKINEHNWTEQNYRGTNQEIDSNYPPSGCLSKMENTKQDTK
ncbi:hypothetical protein Glove_161g14 [Diversispora epigaea]|uniref:RNase H type-1 domain-containing protein n=1 Tax=Diversispora epigaea TaxID=1348612 RepID=A0A397J104_9GLOM|nr:hypothetical protein Glove_161g14 [Diversispora epigaea]